MEKYNIILIEGLYADNCIEKILHNEWFTFFRIDSSETIQIYDFPEPSLIICRADQNKEHSNIKKLLRIINPHDSIPVLFIISLAHNLGLKVLAEGAETSDHINRLSEYGADFVQGYYFSKPLSEKDADKYISGFL